MLVPRVLYLHSEATLATEGSLSSSRSRLSRMARLGIRDACELPVPLLECPSDQDRQVWLRHLSARLPMLISDDAD